MEFKINKMRNKFTNLRDTFSEEYKEQLSEKEISLMLLMINNLISVPIILEDSLNKSVNIDEDKKKISLTYSIMHEINNNTSFVSDILEMANNQKQWEILNTKIVKKLYNEKFLFIA